MKVSKPILSLITALGISLGASAAPRPDDFAYGITITTEGQSSFWEISLPNDIYRQVQRADLGDMRVFDASGQLVPFALRRPGATREKTPTPIDIPLFPLFQNEFDSMMPGHPLRIVTDGKGRIVNTIRETGPLEKKEVISAYLLDASNIARPPEKLILVWESHKETGFTVNVNIDASDDLSTWHRLTGPAMLADLRFGNNRLTHREIELPRHSYKYLRITWPTGLRDVRLEKVVAKLPSAEQPPPHQWLELNGKKDPLEPASYIFDTGGYFPIDMARIKLSSQNTLIAIELSSRPDEAHEWRRKYRGVAYSLLQNDATLLESPPIHFPTISDRNWRLLDTGSEHALDHLSPSLRLAFLPHVLTFVAQGNPPYVIAYGSATIGAAKQGIDPHQFFGPARKQKIQIKTATISTSHPLGGRERLQPPPKPFPWRTVILWGILIAGVALLAWMVWSLSRRLKKD